ncbi:MAG: GNAT family N-acetyltransferase [Hahellaceae bacterium]|nr:GNAT family N-acetyltransferase [Hahellaceae bacterium]MCP5212917.1 GNAT family N-acetyltransferase [Hahellaceae bacterium]
MNNSIKISSYRWESLPADILALRKQIFINEQHVPVELEFDEMDEHSVHFSARLVDGAVTTNDANTALQGEAVGCARLYKSCKRDDQGIIGRMAVHAGHRNKGIAFKLMQAVIRYGVEVLGFTSFKLSAQLTAIDFYKRSGFVPYGDQFIDAGIDHMDMFHMAPALWLARGDQTAEQVKSPLCAGKDESTWHFHNIEECRTLARTMLLQAKNKVEIYSHDLEHELYSDSQIVDYISAIARSHPASEVRLLIKDARSIVKRHHPLVALAERLPSKISIKICDQDYPTTGAAFMLADRYMALHRLEHDVYEGFANFRTAGRVKVLRDEFEAMWQRAKKSKEFGTIGL